MRLDFVSGFQRLLNPINRRLEGHRQTHEYFGGAEKGAKTPRTCSSHLMTATSTMQKLSIRHISFSKHSENGGRRVCDFEDACNKDLSDLHLYIYVYL